MFTTTTYKGELNGVKGLWCGFCPEGVEVEEEIIVYHSDKGKVFMKDGKEFSVIVLSDGESIEDYEEVEKPKETEEVKE